MVNTASADYETEDTSRLLPSAEDTGNQNTDQADSQEADLAVENLEAADDGQETGRKSDTEGEAVQP